MHRPHTSDDTYRLVDLTMSGRSSAPERDLLPRGTGPRPVARKPRRSPSSQRLDRGGLSFFIGTLIGPWPMLMVNHEWAVVDLNH